MASDSPELREAILKGMRILVKVAIRTYMEERAAQSDHPNNGVGNDINTRLRVGQQ